MGFWYVVYKGITSSMGGPAKPTDAPNVPVSTTGDIPLVDAANFEQWMDAPGNAEKWFESIGK